MALPVFRFDNPAQMGSLSDTTSRMMMAAGASIMQNIEQTGQRTEAAILGPQIGQRYAQAYKRLAAGDMGGWDDVTSASSMGVGNPLLMQSHKEAADIAKALAHSSFQLKISENQIAVQKELARERMGTQFQIAGQNNRTREEVARLRALRGGTGAKTDGMFEMLDDGSVIHATDGEGDGEGPDDTGYEEGEGDGNPVTGTKPRVVRPVPREELPLPELPDIGSSGHNPLMDTNPPAPTGPIGEVASQPSVTRVTPPQRKVDQFKATQRDAFAESEAQVQRAKAETALALEMSGIPAPLAQQAAEAIIPPQIDEVLRTGKTQIANTDGIGVEFEIPEDMREVVSTAWANNSGKSGFSKKVDVTPENAKKLDSINKAKDSLMAGVGLASASGPLTEFFKTATEGGGYMKLEPVTEASVVGEEKLKYQICAYDKSGKKTGVLSVNDKPVSFPDNANEVKAVNSINEARALLQGQGIQTRMFSTLEDKPKEEAKKPETLPALDSKSVYDPGRKTDEAKASDEARRVRESDAMSAIGWLNDDLPKARAHMESLRDPKQHKVPMSVAGPGGVPAQADRSGSRVKSDVSDAQNFFDKKLQEIQDQLAAAGLKASEVRAAIQLAKHGKKLGIKWDKNGIATITEVK